MEGVQLFPFAEYWWLYVSFVVGVAALLAVDLGVFHRDAHVVSIKEAGVWVSVWVSLAMLFNFGLYQYSASSAEFVGSPKACAHISN